MSVDWKLSNQIRLGGITGEKVIVAEDAERQERTAGAILRALRAQPGIVLADEVGMGKTYIALAVIASVLERRGRRGAPIVVMVPPGLLEKWRREWRAFKQTCCTHDAFSWVRDEYAYEQLAFLHLVEGDGRADIVWMTTSCFDRQSRDPWIELAIVRWARETMRLDEETSRSIHKWAARMVRKGPRSGGTEEVMRRLLESPHEKWEGILRRAGALDEDDLPPIPKALLDARPDARSWTELRDFLRNEVPGRRGRPADETVVEVGKKLRLLCRRILPELVARAKWTSPLLVLDEAHHAKNDTARLARLFRSRELGNGDNETVPRLRNRFRRMLFLTATPFQLGHDELIRIVRSFAAARWDGPQAPPRSREEFDGAINTLAERLSQSRAAARSLDRTWARLTWDRIEPIAPAEGPQTEDERLMSWWSRVESDPPGELERELVDCVQRCRESRGRAELEPRQEWASLRTWVLRSNRPTHLPGGLPRRRLGVGQSILPGRDEASAGLPLTQDVALPFLLAARAQGEMAAVSTARRLFPHGLASSYEAFHHTRDAEASGEARDVEDELSIEGDDGDGAELEGPVGVVPVEWYAEQIRRYIPDREAPWRDRYLHPKVHATADRVVDLWERGEKVLVFCFYRQTVAALGAHIAAAIERRTAELAAKKLRMSSADAGRWLARATRNIARKDSLLRRAVEDELVRIVRAESLELLRSYEPQLVEWLSRYVRSPSFVSRILPLEREEVQAAFVEGQTAASVFERAAAAFREAVETGTDASGLTFRRRVEEFLRFAAELAERSNMVALDRSQGEDTEVDPLQEYFAGVAGRHGGDSDVGRSARLSEVVRTAHGGTGRETRERLMCAFNSPIFPEVLVSSRILGEGVDLHRFCRHVIHHDLDWNPSVLEQRTGRVDRIHCKAEVTRASIQIWQPFIAGGADEKMFRVVKDRERWFQIVMGQDFKLDEAAAEKLAHRVPLPEHLARDLVFHLEPS